MSEQAEMFAVYRGWGSWKASQIVRTTPKKTIVAVKYTDSMSRQEYLLTENVRCVLPEDRARKLVEKLTSSEAQERQEQAAAGRRHNERVNVFCSRAVQDFESSTL